MAPGMITCHAIGLFYPPPHRSYMLQPTAGGAAQLRSVPSSRADVFKDRQLSPLQASTRMPVIAAHALRLAWLAANAP